MDRLTDKDLTKACNDTWDYCGLDSVCKRDCWKPEKCHIPAQIHRLAEYENTGLTPEEILTLEAQLTRYKQAEDEGRLVELPCKVGDKTYKVGFNCKDNPNPTRYCMCFGKTCKTCEKSFLDVFEVEHETSNIRSIVANMGLCGEAGGFGKTVFLTREQAEQAKEGQNDE